LGQSGEDQYRENVPPDPGGENGSTVQTAPEASESSEVPESPDDSATSDEPEEVVEEPSSEPAPVEGEGSDTLPRTGPDAVPMALLGAALTLLGISLLGATRRSRRYRFR
jgi:LPXTG-motif cell wall-anchored protein